MDCLISDFVVLSPSVATFEKRVVFMAMKPEIGRCFVDLSATYRSEAATW